MPKRARRSRPSALRKKRRYVYKRSGWRRGRGPSRSRVHHFKRKRSNIVPYTGNAVSPQLGSWIFTLGDVMNYAEFTALYDEFRLNFVVLKYYLRVDPGAQSAATADFPVLTYAIDRNDSTVPANTNEIREYSNSRRVVVTPRGVTIKLRPNVLNSVYRSGVLDGSSTPMFKQWVPTALYDTVHYGVKVAIDNFTNTNYKIDVDVTYYFSCRNVK